jgi:hypothetical protein
LCTVQRWTSTPSQTAAIAFSSPGAPSRAPRLWRAVFDDLIQRDLRRFEFLIVVENLKGCHPNRLVTGKDDGAEH